MKIIIIRQLRIRDFSYVIITDVSLCLICRWIYFEEEEEDSYHLDALGLFVTSLFILFFKWDMRKESTGSMWTLFDDAFQWCFSCTSEDVIYLLVNWRWIKSFACSTDILLCILPIMRYSSTADGLNQLEMMHPSPSVGSGLLEGKFQKLFEYPTGFLFFLFFFSFDFIPLCVIWAELRRGDISKKLIEPSGSYFLLVIALPVFPNSSWKQNWIVSLALNSVF